MANRARENKVNPHSGLAISKNKKIFFGGDLVRLVSTPFDAGLAALSWSSLCAALTEMGSFFEPKHLVTIASR